MSNEIVRAIVRVFLLLCAVLCLPVLPAAADVRPQPALYGELLADGQLVYGPNVGDFDVRRYLDDLGSPLLPYSAIIDEQCGFASVNPRVVLTLLEMRQGLVSGGAAAVAPAAVTPAAVGPDDFPSYVAALATDVSLHFYRHLYAYGSRSAAPMSPVVSLRLADGATVELAGAGNPATYAVLATLAPLSAAEEWDSYASPASSESFGAVYRRLFPESDPLDNSNVINAPSAPPADLFQLPFPVGATWWFNGPHNWRGDGEFYGPPFSSMDFATGSDSCSALPGDLWATAAAGGNGYHPSDASCWYRIDHGNGWMTSYYHTRNTIANGAVSRNARVGTIACETCVGGTATAPHVHFSLLYNGAYVDLNGTVLSGWTVHTGDGSYGSGYLTRDGVTKTPYQGVYNGGVTWGPDTTPPDGDLTSPAKGAVITGRYVNLAAWAVDHQSGVRWLRFNAKWDNAWRRVYEDASPPYEYLWDLCDSAVPDGDIEISIHVQDLAGNNFYLGSKNATRHITKRHDCSFSADVALSLWLPVVSWRPAP